MFTCITIPLFYLHPMFTAKIKSYISKFYHYEVNADKLKRKLEEGVEKGLWERLGSSSFHLLTEMFSPNRSTLCLVVSARRE